MVDIIKNVRCELKDALNRYPEADPINKWVIAYAFTFTAVEDNRANGAADFTIPIAHGSFRIGFDAGTVRHREGEKQITLAERIGNVRKLDCTALHRTNSSHYPILGRVGITEVIDRYASLMREDKVKIGVFTDQLFFTLNYAGGVRSSATIVPLSGHNRSFVLNAAALREDRHKLLLQITPPAPPKEPLEIAITNFEDFQPVVVQTVLPGSRPLEEAPPAGGVAPRARAVPPARRAPAADSRSEALRELDYQQSLKIQQRILDALPPR